LRLRIAGIKKNRREREHREAGKEQIPIKKKGTLQYVNKKVSSTKGERHTEKRLQRA